MRFHSRLNATGLMLAGLACAVGCGPRSNPAAVTGTVTTGDGATMPPEAVVEVTLEDVSRADAPATEVGRVRFRATGSASVPFEISYDPADIVESNTYAVRARVRVNDELRWISDTSYPVLTRDYGDTADISVVDVRPVAGNRAEGRLGGLPASFSGTVPCASCPGIEMQVDLFPDHGFYLGRTYLDQAGPEDVGRRYEWGRWSVSSDGLVLALHSGRESPVFFSIEGTDELRLRDVRGEEIVSDLPYSLVRSDVFEAMEPTGQFRGTYRYLADAASFRECLTGRTYDVHAEDEGLERAYLEARQRPDQELLVVVDGSLALREGMEGGLRPAVIVQRFVRLLPRESCGEPMARASFAGTNWQLTELRGEAFVARPDQLAGHLVFDDEGGVVGSGGCNRVTGVYERDEGALSFGLMATTSMACAEGMAAEAEFLAALPTVTSWQIMDQHLELYDAAGGRIARFEAAGEE